MASNILKGFTVAAGAGLALGFGRARFRQTAAMSNSPSDNVHAHEQLLERLDRIEARIGAVEDSDNSAVAELGLRIERQAKMIETLKVQFSGTRQSVESILEKTIGPRIEDLRARLRAEVLESVNSALATFERMIDAKVSLRVSTIEKALIEQSSSIRDLSQRTVSSEANLQRLIAAVERLCAQKDGQLLEPIEQPVERQPSDAARRTSLISPMPTDSGFRPRIVPEEDNKLRHRRPLSRL
jgi:hypothetical protein